MEHTELFEKGCCPRFNPEPWEKEMISYDEKLFVKDQVVSFMHVPLNFGGVMKRMMGKIDAVESCQPDPIVMTDEKSLWGADVFIGVDKEIPGAEMVKISGSFMPKIFEGPYKDMSKFVKEMLTYVTSKGQEMKKQYFGYAYCPRCAKAYGKNIVVILAQV